MFKKKRPTGRGEVLFMVGFDENPQFLNWLLSVDMFY